MTLTLTHPSARGAIYMVLAGMAFAGVNISIQKVTMSMGVDPTTAAFWQYFIAMLFSLPLMLRIGVRGLVSPHFGLHIFRVILAVLGIQLWVAGLAHVPIWQAIALVMISPFFVTLGAWLLLRERVGPSRWLATVVGFAGALVILQPWSDGFSSYTLLPIGAAVLWAGSSLIMKRLTAFEHADKVTIYLLALLLPINAIFAGVGGGFVVAGLSAGPILLIAGLLTALAQYLLARAYEVADASYVQPFDHIKLPLNVLAGWLVFGYLPSGNLWVGAAMIIGASLFIAGKESR
ncbi:MAG: DMT family transporter [Rhodobacteraceae bacterium]|nr:DMT family transporter [Paracoccaceae bacterium]